MASQSGDDYLPGAHFALSARAHSPEGRRGSASYDPPRGGPVNLFLMAGIVLAAAAVSVAVVLVVRRRIRDEATMEELDRRVPGIFAFVGTAFAVLLAFVVLEAFENYDQAREGGDTEAVTALQISRTADGFAPAERDNFEGLLLCYARAVVHHDWPAMKNGAESSAQADLWSRKMREAMLHINTDTDLRYISLFQMQEEQDNRTAARETREVQAGRNVPAPMWFVLILGALLTIAGSILYVARRGSALLQGALVASVAALATASLLLVLFLDHPYEGGAGSLKPLQMERAITTMEQEQHIASAPCTATGDPLT